MTLHSIKLLGRVPSKKNNLRRIKRGNRIFSVPSEAHEAWHTEQMYVLKKYWNGREIIKQTEEVEIFFTPPDNRKGDLSNKAESVMDLLVDAGILEDDNWFVVKKLILNYWGMDKKNPSVLIKITEK